MRDLTRDAIDFSERSAIYLARAEAFTAAARTVSAFRLAVAWGAYAAGIAAVIARWSSLNAVALFVILVATATLRAIGNGIVNVWGVREAERIKARLPIEPLADDSASEGGAT